MSFVHLNVKSCFCFMNSIVKLDEAIRKTSKNGLTYLAITDINTMHTFFDFQNGCKDDKHVLHGLKPIKHIFGVNFLVQSKYLENEFFLLNLIARNEVGYKNLIELSTLANTNHQQFAWVTYEDIERFSEGLFCLTGAETGEVFTLEIQGKHQKAMDMLKYLKGIFGDYLYLEVSNHFIKDEITFLESGIIDDAIAIGIEPVATNDVYYLNKKDAEYRALAVEMNSELNDLKANEVDWIHKYASRYVDFNNEFYLKTEKQMEDAFRKYLKKYPNLLNTSQTIANMCDVEVPIERRFPEFPLPDGYTTETYFRKLMLEGFQKRFPDDKSFGKGFTRQDYIDRMEYEYGIVESMGFLGYLLIVQDYIQFAKDDEVYKHPEVYFPTNHYPDYSKISNRILNKDFKIMVGPGRGSGAGSLLCYLLGITNINPLPDGLLFERFLNPDRVSMPEIGQSV